jgi:hypothetical protein
MYRRPTRIIVPQYSPPVGLSLLACAELLGENKRGIAAQLVDLAVRGAVSVSRPSQPPRRRTGFELTLQRSPFAYDDDERELLIALFDSREAGAKVTIARGRNRALGLRLRDPNRMAVVRLVKRGLVEPKTLKARLAMAWRKQPTRPLPAAQPAIDHLWGLRDFIDLVEKDRFAALQSPDGAHLDPAGQYRLYERLLPYAVLFGVEEQWAKQLGLFAEQVRDGIPLDGAFDLMVDLGDLARLADLGDLLQLVDMPDLSDLGDLGDVANAGDLVDLGGVLEGVGAVFGGIVEFLGNLSP